MTDLQIARQTTVTRAAGPAPAAIRAGIGATARISPGLAGRLALELWRRPGRPGEVRPGERAVHESARVGVIPHAGSFVVTYAWGDGARPVLLVHGWRSRASRFATLVTALEAAGYSPVSYDAWAHGATKGPVRTILDHEQVITALAERHGGFEAVVAHSFGVPVAMYAVRQGVRADRVVALSGMSDFGHLVDSFCTTLGLGAPVDEQLRRAIERRYFDGDSSIWRRFSVGPIPGLDLLVMHSPEDRMVDRGQADLLVASQGDRATLIETPGLGHGRILDDPGVIDATVRFVGRRP